MDPRYHNRAEGGRVLAAELQDYGGRDDLLVLALPRGGVPVGFEIAMALGAPLDVVLVRKLGVPWQPELAMGAVASGNVLVLQPQILTEAGISEADIRDAVERQSEIVREQDRTYRGELPAPDIFRRIVILVDDGLATGSTMRAAISAVCKQQPAMLIVAVPTAPPETCRQLAREVDKLICPHRPRQFFAISQSYECFDQVENDQVRRCLEEARGALAMRQVAHEHFVRAPHHAADV